MRVIQRTSPSFRIYRLSTEERGPPVSNSSAFCLPCWNIVFERDVHRGALRQFALRITHHLAERRVHLGEAFVEADHRHSNGRILKDLAEALLARLKGGSPIRD